MQSDGPLDLLPLWGAFFVILLLVLVSVEVGYRLGKYRSRNTEEKESAVGAMVGATLGLLAFMLAFTFGLAAERFDERRQAVLDEANAIGSAYLRAGMIGERREEIRALLRTYVDTRLEAIQSGHIAEGIRQSERLQTQLWTHAETIAGQHPTSVTVGLFVQSVNDVIDLHAKRVTFGVRNRIPPAIWLALLTVAALSLTAMGYHAGLSRTSRSVAEIVVAGAFAVVLGLIADLDRPQEGFLKVSQQALIDARQSMQPPRK